MSYRLTLIEPEGADRAISESVFLGDLNKLPLDYKIYVFFIPRGGFSTEDLQESLRRFGASTGNNVLISFESLGSEHFRQLVRRFEIKDLPAIVITAIHELAATPTEFFTAYVRIDNRELLASPDRTTDLLQRLVNLFLQGKVSEAMGEAEKEGRDVIITRIIGTIAAALRNVGSYLSERDISVSISEFKLELKRNNE